MNVILLKHKGGEKHTSFTETASCQLIVIIVFIITNNEVVANCKQIISKKTTIVVASKHIIYATKSLSEILSDCNRYDNGIYFEAKTSDIN